jgi:hypothetical protein
MIELRNKKGAFEMSMSTVIIIVLAVIFLILGLVLLRNIFSVATGSISSIDEKLKTQLITLFADEDSSTVFIRPEDGVLKIRADTTDFGFIIGAKTKNGNDIVNWGDVQYRLIFDKESSCYKKLGEATIKKWFTNSKIASGDKDTESYNPLNWAKNGDVGLARIQLTIPKGTMLCTQTVLFDFIDKTDSTLTQPLDGAAFSIQVLRKVF